MNENENVAYYFLHFDEVVNSIEGLGEIMDNKVVVRRILISLLMRFGVEVSVLEEREDSKNDIMDELHGILTTQEMTIEQEIPSNKK